MKGSDIIVKMLKLYGTNVIFGYPGASILDIYNSIRSEGVRHILTATENGAITAADGYARSTRGLGVVMATSGPGASNLITGLAAANLDGTALLAITGNVPSTSLGTDSFQEVDTSGIAMPITKYSHIVKDADTLAESLAETMSIALQGRRGAVLIDIPQDIQQAEVNITENELSELLIRYGLINHATPDAKSFSTDDSDLTLKPIVSQSNTSGANGINNLKRAIIANYNAASITKDIERATEIINSVSKPIILIGGGVRLASAERETTALAKKLNCPVVTTLMGVSLYDNTAPNYFGLTGVYGNPTANHALRTADAIISLGVRFNDRLRATGCLENKQLIQFDIDDAENGKTIEASIYIKGDLKATLPQLIQSVNGTDGKFVRSMTAHRIKVGRGDNNRHMRNAFAVVNEILSDSDIVTTDVGTHQMALAKNYSLKGTFLTNGGLGAMGWGLGAAIGALVANTENIDESTNAIVLNSENDNNAFDNGKSLSAKTNTLNKNNLDDGISRDNKQYANTLLNINSQKGILISGDGSFNMEMQELITAVSLSLPLIVVIFNNNSLEMFRRVQEERFGYEFMARPTVKVDYVMLARSMGASGVRARTITQLRNALKSFNGTPLLIDFEV